MRVYVAGKYSDDNVLDVLCNIGIGIKESARVLLNGMSPFCPWLDYHFILEHPHKKDLTVEMFYKYCLDWLEVADVIYVIGDNWEGSKGTLAEISRANELNIPVVYSLRDLLNFKNGATPLINETKKHCMTCRHSCLGTGGMCLNKPECATNGYKYWEEYKERQV